MIEHTESKRLKNTGQFYEKCKNFDIYIYIVTNDITKGIIKLIENCLHQPLKIKELFYIGNERDYRYFFNDTRVIKIIKVEVIATYL